MSDSQGSAPSTFWGEDVLTEMREGRSAVEAVAEITGKNPGRGRRQHTAFNVQGGTGHLVGAESIPVCGAAETNQAIFAIASRIDECAGLATGTGQDLLEVLPDLLDLVRQPCFSDKFRDMVVNIAARHGIPEHRWHAPDSYAVPFR